MGRPVLTIGRHADPDVDIDRVGSCGGLGEARLGGGGRLFGHLKDLKSTDGTIVNGRRVQQTEHHPCDWITIGKHILTLRIGWR